MITALIALMIVLAIVAMMVRDYRAWGSASGRHAEETGEVGISAHKGTKDAQETAVQEGTGPRPETKGVAPGALSFSDASADDAAVVAEETNIDVRDATDARDGASNMWSARARATGPRPETRGVDSTEDVAEETNIDVHVGAHEDSHEDSHEDASIEATKDVRAPEDASIEATKDVRAPEETNDVHTVSSGPAAAPAISGLGAVDGTEDADETNVGEHEETNGVEEKAVVVLEQENDALRQKLVNTTDTVNRLEQENDALRQKLVNTTDTVNRIELEKNDLKSVLEQENEALRQKLVNTTDTVNSLELDKHDLETRYTAVSGSLMEALQESRSTHLKVKSQDKTVELKIVSTDNEPPHDDDTYKFRYDNGYLLSDDLIRLHQDINDNMMLRDTVHHAVVPEARHTDFHKTIGLVKALHNVIHYKTGARNKMRGTLHTVYVYPER